MHRNIKLKFAYESSQAIVHTWPSKAVSAKSLIVLNQTGFCFIARETTFFFSERKMLILLSKVTSSGYVQLLCNI